MSKKFKELKAIFEKYGLVGDNALNKGSDCLYNGDWFEASTNLDGNKNISAIGGEVL